jgi:nitrogen-specific signal transduction histidine kinase
MTEAAIFEKLMKSKEAQSLPQVLAEVIRVSDQEDTTAKELTAIVSKDLIFKQYLIVEQLLRDNREMQDRIAQEQVKKAALESLKTITVTLSHYINNASATIMGRAQMVQHAISRGTIEDGENIAHRSMKSIIKSVKTISIVLEELKKMSGFDTARYIESTSILDIEDRLKTQLESIKDSNRNGNE